MRKAILMLGVLGFAACSDTFGPQAGTSLPDVAFAKGSGSSGSASTTETRVRIRLASAATPVIAGATGEGRYEVKGTRIVFKAEVEHIPAGTVVEFFLNGVSLGKRTADALGEAELELKNAAAPAAVAGLLLEAKNASGAVIVSGTFPA